MSIEEEEEKFMEELGRRSEILLENLSQKEASVIEDQIDEAIENRQELVQQHCLRSKKYLDLGSCQIDDFDSLTIGIYLNELHSNIEVINLAANKLTDEGLLNMLVGMQFHSNLRELYLGNNQFSIGTAIEGLATILPCLKNLRILGLGGLNIDDEDLVKILYGISEIDTLKNLQLHKNKISDEGLICIISMMLLGFGNELETLYLGQNDEITEEGIVKLFETLYDNKTLKCLHLNDIIMTDKSLTAINISLMSNRCIEELNLGNCGIDDEGFKIFQDCLKHNDKLQYLHLWNNYLTYESAEIIQEILDNYNSVLKGITLYNNDIINTELLKDIESLTQQNQYFETTVRNEEFYDKKIEEMKRNYTKEKQAQAAKEQSSDILLQGKVRGFKNIPQQQNATNKPNLSSSSISSSASASASNSKLSVSNSKQSVSTSSTVKRPQSGVPNSKPPTPQGQSSNGQVNGGGSKLATTSTRHQASNSISTTKISSSSKIPQTPVKTVKTESKSSSTLKDKIPLTKVNSKEVTKKSSIPISKSSSQSKTKKDEVQNLNEDDEDIEYVSLSSNLNGSVVKKDFSFDDLDDDENDENKLEQQQKGKQETKQDIITKKGDIKAKEDKKPANSLKDAQQKEEEGIDFEEEWLDDDEEDERELQKLEKQLEEDEEIITKERNTRLEYIDEFYNEEESNKQFKQYDKYNRDNLKYDNKDPNTLKWQGFFEDKSSGLLKSKYS